MNLSEISVEVGSGGASTLITLLAATSAQSPAVSNPTNHPDGAPVKVLVMPTVNVFVRKGANPTAVADGTDQFLLANNLYRVELMEGEKMAFISPGAGSVYWTPGA